MARQVARLWQQRVAWGLLLAPLGPAVFVAWHAHEPDPLFATYGYLSSVHLGLPLLLVYKAFGLRRWWHFVLGGFGLAFAITLALAHTLYANPATGWDQMLPAALESGAVWSIAAAAFWGIAIFARTPRPLRA